MPNILHMGVGNFHRAHQAWYTQKSNQLEQNQWQIIGVSLQRPSMRDALMPQGYNYTLVTKNGADTDFEQISVHSNILVAPENPASVIAQVANPDVKIVTTTVTEKGYHIDPATGCLDVASPDIQSDLRSDAPVTLIGFLSLGLKARAANEAGPLTVISCDNLSNNGAKLRQLVHEFSEAAGLEISQYLEDFVTFPNTMVDRIVPATSEELKAEVLERTRQKDASPVATEPFSEWIIEDNFAAERPKWDNVGVTIVKNVDAYEMRKLRLLNGPHSLLAYAGLNAGYEYVHEAVADEHIRSQVVKLMDEATDTLPAEILQTVPAYRQSLLERFSNPSLNHLLKQIASDGSLKIPVRVLPVLSELNDRKAGSAAEYAVENWSEFVFNTFQSGGTLQDPNNGRLLEIFHSAQGKKEAKELFKRSIGDTRNS